MIAQAIPASAQVLCALLTGSAACLLLILRGGGHG
jgi:hypothetical protein